jgi:hypothetical protein
VLREYVKQRVQKYDDSKEVKKRLDHLKKQVQDHPNKLFVIVCDEAHYGATDKTPKGEDSGYNKVVNYWNSEYIYNINRRLMLQKMSCFTTFFQ